MNQFSTRISIALTALATAAVAVVAHAQVSTMPIGGSATPAPSAAPVPVPVTDAKTEFEKARELFQRDQFQDANDANEKALAIDPTFKDAILLKSIIQSKLANPTSATAVATTGPGATQPATALRLLTLAQISHIRIAELAPDDTGLRGKVPRKTLDDFWNSVVKYQLGGNPTRLQYNDFMNPSNFTEQVKSISKADKAEFKDQVELLSDPTDMQAFRSLVHPYVLQNCATVGCHGSAKAGDFRLARPTAGITDNVVYTNFLILDSKQLADGRKMIDRNAPDQSLVLQYGLPKKSAQFPHPGKIEVRHFPDAFSAEYKSMVAWIAGLKQPHPNYGVVYTMSGTATP